MAGITGILIFSASVLLFFCLLSGYLFTRLTVELSRRYKANLLGKSYAIESMGSIAGGLLFSFLLVYFLGTFHILFLMLIINLSVAVVIYQAGRRWILFAGLISILVFVLVFTAGPGSSLQDPCYSPIRLPLRHVILRMETWS